MAEIRFAKKIAGLIDGLIEQSTNDQTGQVYISFICVHLKSIARRKLGWSAEKANRVICALLTDFGVDCDIGGSQYLTDKEMKRMYNHTETISNRRHLFLLMLKEAILDQPELIRVTR